MAGWEGMAWAWRFPAGSVLVVSLSLAIYLRGWRRLRRAEPWRWNWTRAGCFGAGLLALGIALWSPLDTLGAWLLSAHMAQHFLLSMVVPPLLLLGWLFQPMLAGLPRWCSRDLLGPILGWPALQRLAQRLVHPPLAWALSIAATWGWHLPPAYEWALQDPLGHALEHACFLGTGILFWWSVVQPWPWRGSWPRWTAAPYLLAADVANTIVAAVLAFASAPIYRVYDATAPALGVSPLLDQQRAAAIMWLPGTLVFLVPAVVIMVRSMSGRPRASTVSLRVLQSLPARRSRWDATRVPWLGPLLRKPGARLALRMLFLVIAGLIVADGFLGPAEAPTTLAGTWPWTQWRGLAAVSVVLAGNLACMSCPLIAPRTLLRRWIRPSLRWPSRLRSKWLVAVMVLAWLVAYEALAWWDSGPLTAWLIVGLVIAATLVDLLFEGSSFCQWLCPIGQWNMSMSVASPTQVQVIDPAVCERCVTQDCLRGGPLGPGCGTSLFLPRKGGALDCTACMDCVTACPHGNAGVRVSVPFGEFRSESGRSVIGRWVDRADIAALLLVLGAGGIGNALLMTQPAIEWARAEIPVDAPWMRAAIITMLAIGLVASVPVILAMIGAAIRREPFRERLARLVADLWPLGVAIWVVHFGFHLVTGWRSAWPPLQRAARDATGLDLGEPQWASHCCASMPAWLMPAMLLVLAMAFTLSLQHCWMRADGSNLRERLLRWWPDAVACALWWGISAWVVLQPMEMRGLLG